MSVDLDAGQRMRDEQGSRADSRVVAQARGARLRKLRKAARGVDNAPLLQDDVADFCDVSRSAVSQWETGNTEKIDYEHLKKLSVLFDVSIEYIEYGETDEAGDATPALSLLSLTPTEGSAGSHTAIPLYRLSDPDSIQSMIDGGEPVTQFHASIDWILAESRIGMSAENAKFLIASDATEHWLGLRLDAEQFVRDGFYAVEISGSVFIRRVSKSITGSLSLTDEASSTKIEWRPGDGAATGLEQAPRLIALLVAKLDVQRV